MLKGRSGSKARAKRAAGKSKWTRTRRRKVRKAAARAVVSFTDLEILAARSRPLRMIRAPTRSLA